MLGKYTWFYPISPGRVMMIDLLEFYVSLFFRVQNAPYVQGDEPT